MAKKETRIPYYRLRQKAPRALMVFERHKAEPTIALFEATLVPVTNAFMAQFDATHAFEMARPAKSAAQTKAVLRVRGRTEVWLAFLERDVTNFDARAYEADAGSAVNVISAAERLLTFIGDLAVHSPPLHYVAAMQDDLTEALRLARQDWVDARASLNELQARQAETRKHAVVFERELDTFRRALRVILGEHDSDYQSLCVTRRPKVDEPTLEPATTPAPDTNPGLRSPTAFNPTLSH